ncbi:hypothetical protein ACVSLE_17610, partial [Pseudomonas aeruginosa]
MEHLKRETALSLRPGKNRASLAPPSCRCGLSNPARAVADRPPQAIAQVARQRYLSAWNFVWQAGHDEHHQERQE